MLGIAANPARGQFTPPQFQQKELVAQLALMRWEEGVGTDLPEQEQLAMRQAMLESMRDLLRSVPDHPMGPILLRSLVRQGGIPADAMREVLGDTALAPLFTLDGFLDIETTPATMKQVLQALADQPGNALWPHALVAMASGSDPRSDPAARQMLELAAAAPAIHPELKRAIQQSIGTASTSGGQPVRLVFTALDGREVDTEQYKGSYVLIDFWSTTCPPCIAEMPNLRRLHENFGGKGLEIVGIPMDVSPSPVKAMLTRFQIPWPQEFVEGLPSGWFHPTAKKFGINKMPTYMLLGPDGTIFHPDTTIEAVESLMHDRAQANLANDPESMAALAQVAEAEQLIEEAISTDPFNRVMWDAAHGKLLAAAKQNPGNPAVASQILRAINQAPVSYDPGFAVRRALMERQELLRSEDWAGLKAELALADADRQSLLFGLPPADALGTDEVFQSGRPTVLCFMHIDETGRQERRWKEFLGWMERYPGVDLVGITFSGEEQKLPTFRRNSGFNAPVGVHEIRITREVASPPSELTVSWLAQIAFLRIGTPLLMFADAEGRFLSSQSISLLQLKEGELALKMEALEAATPQSAGN